MARLTKRDLRMFDLMCRMETCMVADELGITVVAINCRFDWIRKKRVEAQRFLNIVLNYEKKCPDLRRRLTPTTKQQIA